MATPQEIAQMMRYGPQTQGLIRRSEYLDKYLQASLQPEQPIRSGGELAARLLATAILSRGANKARDATLNAVRADRQTAAEKIIAALRPQRPPPASPPPLAGPQAPAPEMPVVAAPPPVAQAALQPARYTAEDRDAFIRMLATEAGGEPEPGLAAAGHVALNRLNTGYGGARSLRDVVLAPNQFEGMGRAGQVSPEDYARIAPVADRILSGQLADPTGGAINFLNPDLQLQLGRQIPEWARGQGQRIGRHVFFGGRGPQPQELAQQGLPPPPQPPDPSGPPDQAAPPYDVATLGPPPAPPSASASSPAVAEAPPAGPPQAPAGGVPAQWPTYQPTEAEIGLVQSLLNDPATFDQGLAEAQKLRMKMAQPAPAKIVEMNGVQFYVPETPGQGGPPMMIPIPQQAMTRHVDARTLNPTATAGTTAQLDPYGNAKEGIGGPPENMQAVMVNGQLQYVPVKGSREDPTRVQAPPPNYTLQTGPGGAPSYAPIPNSPADLRSPVNVMEAANRYGSMVKTVVDAAMKVKQNYGAVMAGIRQQNGTGDIASINGLQKLIDDGVVKSEDVTMQMRSNGLEGTLGSYAQYLRSGGLLTPEVRAKVAKTATDLYRNLDNTYRVRIQSLAPGFDEVYGEGAFGKYVFPDAFAAELGWSGDRRPTDASTAAPGAPAAPVQYPDALNKAHAAAVARGEYDPKAPLGSQRRPFLAADEAAVRAIDIPANKGKFVRLPNGDVARID